MSAYHQLPEKEHEKDEISSENTESDTVGDESGERDTPSWFQKFKGLSFDVIITSF